ncbi:hypothetical protein EVAR_82532_1 [Eumeta japonica]|uniref:Uncharacterized protein n=1 Tax=Eumeta variegata TaxID=151549 RepID=A0A4C1UX31_EUMVA|nr:hypothetical protein EVAR_82532_1 [Eumeta japonica]
MGYKLRAVTADGPAAERGREGRVEERNTCAVFHSRAVQSGKVSCVVSYSLYRTDTLRPDVVQFTQFDRLPCIVPCAADVRNASVCSVPHIGNRH